MAFQNTAFGVDLWRFIAGIGIGLEQVTIDTLLPEFVPPQARGRAFAFYQFVEFCVVPVVALLGWLLVPRHPWGLDGWRWVTLDRQPLARFSRGGCGAEFRKARAGWRCMDARPEADAIVRRT